MTSMTTAQTALFVLAALPALSALGCRGEISRKPPIHFVKDMDFQPKIKAQSKFEFPGWHDQRGMREPVPHTLARGQLREHDPDPAVAKLHVWVTARDAEGTPTAFVNKNPLPLTKENLDRGRERYDIHCAICHGRTGRGNGPVGLRLKIKPSSYLSKAGPEPFPDRKPEHQKPDRMEERVQKLVDGDLFEVITNGRTTMPGYGHQVPVKDRWCIVHYIRALQLRVK